MLESNTNIM